MAPEFMTAGVVVLGIWGIEAVRLAGRYFFNRFASADYVTVEVCEKCRNHCALERSKGEADIRADMAEMRKDVRIVKQVVLSLAAKLHMNTDDLKDLVG